MINKKVFALTLIASSVIAAGCSSDDDDDGDEVVFDQTSDAVLADAQSVDVTGDGILTDDDDFNGDGFIDNTDVELFAAVVTDANSTDVNGDGSIDGNDDIDRDGDVDDDDATAFGTVTPPDGGGSETAFVYPAFDGEGDTDSVADIIANEPRLSTLATTVPPALLAQLDFTEEKRAALIEANGADDDDTNDDETMIPEAVDYTVFAPVDTALAAADLAGLSGEELSNLLLGHVVAGTVTAADVQANAAENDGAGGTALTALNGGMIMLSNNESGGPVINENINFAGAATNEDGTESGGSQEADNGIVHLIDTVILPAEGTTPPTTTNPNPPTAGDAGPVESGLINSSANSQFTQQFLASFQGSLDNETERTAQPWTVFAPTNDALGGGTLDLQNYIATTGAFDPEELAAAGTVTTNNGVSHQVTGSADGGDLSVDGNLVTVISESDNAIVYSVDGILN